MFSLPLHCNMGKDCIMGGGGGGWMMMFSLLLPSNMGR